MAKYQQLFIYVICLVIFYILVTRLGILPEQISGYPSRKWLKFLMGLAIAVGSLVIYFRNISSKDSKSNPDS